jgi:hypothetical protein
MKNVNTMDLMHVMLSASEASAFSDGEKADSSAPPQNDIQSGFNADGAPNFSQKARISSKRKGLKTSC